VLFPLTDIPDEIAEKLEQKMRVLDSVLQQEVCEHLSVTRVACRGFYQLMLFLLFPASCIVPGVHTLPNV